MIASLPITLEHALWAGLAAACFAVLFNVPPRALLACWITGMVGHAVRSLLVSAELATSAPASMLAALTVSMVGVGWGKRLAAPAVVFILPGVIPLVPGALAFHTIVDVIALLNTSAGAQQAALTAAAVGFIRTLAITAALATGVAIPSIVLHRKRPIL